MADRITKGQRSENMRRIKARDTKPEMIVRKLVHAMGYRYRLHRKELPGKPDLVFGPKRRVIFVHGCFWHQHDSPDCPLSNRPKSNNSYWDAKLERNVNRDIKTMAELQALGWQVLVIWECETGRPDSLSAMLKCFLQGGTHTLNRTH